MNWGPPLPRQFQPYYYYCYAWTQVCLLARLCQLIGDTDTDWLTVIIISVRLRVVVFSDHSMNDDVIAL